MRYQNLKADTRFIKNQKRAVLNIDEAIEEYNKKNGFSITEKDGRFSIADIILRERKSTGEVINETPYYKIFDTVTGKRIER